MSKPLTPKQEKFAQGVASGMNKSAAYKAAYATENMSDATIYSQAYRLGLDPHIAARVDELRMPIEEQVGITLQSYIAEMMALKQSALDAEEHGAAIKAMELTGKCLGYYVTKTELTGKGGGPVEHKITRDIIDPVDGNDQY